MEYTIENKNISLTVDTKGAEIQSLIDKKEGRELIFDADTRYWGRHAPILFPNVGKYTGGSFRVGTCSFTEGQHGFARDMEFKLREKTYNSLVFTLSSNEKTKERYPFDFLLTVSYTLHEDYLDVDYQVENTGEDPMYFTIGGHPAFNLLNTWDKHAHQLYFPGLSSLTVKRLNPKTGCALAEETVYPLEEERLALSEDLFKNDAMILDDSQVKEAWLETKNGRKLAGLRSDDFPNYGIWSVEGAPFVCLEPWAGRTDDDGFSGELSEKSGINTLLSGSIFNKAYQILIP